MTIAIVGGTGFIGSEVAARLMARGEDTLVVSRGRHPVALPEGARYAKADRMDGDTVAGLLRDNGVTAVIDIFALSLRNTQPLLDAVGQVGARYVLVSSTDVYSNYAGLLRKDTPAVRPEPATEDSSLRTALYPYRSNSRRPQGVEDDLFEDYDKIPIEAAAMADPRFPATVVRLPMVFGPNDKQHRFAWIINAALAGRPIALDARAAAWRNSYGYVTDMADALALAATHEAAAGRIYNAAQAQVRTVREWAETVLGVMGVAADIREVPPDANGIMADRAEASDLRYPLTLDSTRIRAELGYSEVVIEDDALQATIAWETAGRT